MVRSIMDKPEYLPLEVQDMFSLNTLVFRKIPIVITPGGEHWSYTLQVIQNERAVDVTGV